MQPVDEDDDDKTPVTAGKVLVCTFDPWHTVKRFERRIALLCKRLPLDEASKIFLMSDGMPLCADCKMLMERLAVPVGVSAIKAPRFVAENFAFAMKLTREGQA
jgi:hypothetical protein